MAFTFPSQRAISYLLADAHNFSVNLFVCSSYHIIIYSIPQAIRTCDINFVAEILYLLISLTYFSHLHMFLPSGDHLFILCIYDTVSALLCLFFVLFFRFHR